MPPTGGTVAHGAAPDDRHGEPACAELRLAIEITIDHRHEDSLRRPISWGDRLLDTAKIFVSDRSQAARLPRAFRVAGREVLVKRIGNAVVLVPTDDPLNTLVQSLAMFDPGFEIVRDQPPGLQEREPLLP
jgi:antitoxin VapB